MKVSIQNLAVTMDLGNNGTTFEVRLNDGVRLGDLRIGKAKIEWCKGKTRQGNGKEVGWEEMIKWFESK